MARSEASDHPGPSEQHEPTGSPSALNNSLLLERVNANKDSKFSSGLGIASTLYQICLKILTKASRQYMTSPEVSRLQKTLLRDSHARLCLFGDGLIDHGGLEVCLQLDDELSGDMIALLCDTGKLLLRGLRGGTLNIVDPARCHEGLVSELKTLLDKASEITSHHHTEGDSDEAASTASDNDGEVAQSDVENNSIAIDDEVLRGLDICTTTMMDIRPLLDEAIHDALARPSKAATHSEAVDFKVTEAARSYVVQVHDKYPTAKAFLVERLGEANWQRYMRIKAKIESGKAKEDLAEVPKSLFKTFSASHDSGHGAFVPSRSRYAASNSSHTSFLSTSTDATKSRTRVPATPSEVTQGRPFTCSICCEEISTVKSRIDWKMHVFADLRAYICTFEDCTKMLDTYPSRKLWAEHEFTEHRCHNFFQCHDCWEKFTIEREYRQHLVQKHQYGSLNHRQLLSTLSAAKKSTPEPIASQRCPLCQEEGWGSQRSFVTHVGRHLEAIALSALPKDVGSDSEAESDDSQSAESISTKDRYMRSPNNESQVQVELILEQRRKDEAQLKQIQEQEQALVLERANRDLNSRQPASGEPEVATHLNELCQAAPVMHRVNPTSQQELNSIDALSYLDRVKTTYLDQPDVYNRFLGIMADFKSQGTDTLEVISQIAVLFYDTPALIAGFNVFLPPGWKVEWDIDGNSGTGRAVSPGATISTISPCNHDGTNLLPQIRSYSTESVPRAGLPGVSEASSANPKRGPVDYNHAITYVSKIKARFVTQPEIYRQFLNLLQTSQRGSRSTQEVYSEIGVLFYNAPDLIEEFKEFLPETATHARAQATTSAPATVDGVEAARSKKTARSPTSEDVLASSPTLYSRPRRESSASFVPFDTETVPKKKGRPTRAALDRSEQPKAEGDNYAKWISPPDPEPPSSWLEPQLTRSSKASKSPKGVPGPKLPKKKGRPAKADLDRRRQEGETQGQVRPDRQ